MVPVILLISVIVQLIGGVPLHSDLCSNNQRTLGLCEVSANVGDADVTLIGSATGSSGDSDSPTGGAAVNRSTPNRGSGRQLGTDPGIPCQLGRLVGDRCAATLGKSTKAATATTPDAFTITAPITLRDIASFRPTPGRQQMEPNGWVVAGLDANFYALTGTQLVNGTLLGRPAVVRFTPVAYHWTYGDGAAADRGVPGGPWAAQHLRDFDPTPTSHVYAMEGDYTIRLTIGFRAEYSFGGAAFVPITGLIQLPANDLHVAVTGAKTVLVDQDCVANPSGPGC